MIGAIAIILLIGLPIYHYGSLPDMIPIDYGSNGQPDGYSKKASIWIFPAVGIVMYVGKAVLNKLSTPV
ncbi:MAG: DUF1648 domain-containing protein [Bacteroidetes bacterium]|nr:DUF1648 domain-containing protein [Bacteroidota bacterium]